MRHPEPAESCPLNAEGRPITGMKRKSVALLLTLVCNGLGHLYLGLWKKGLAFIVVEAIFYAAFYLIELFDDGFSMAYGMAFLITSIAYLLLWFYCMITVVKWTERNNSEWCRYNGLPDPASGSSTWDRPAFLDPAGPPGSRKRNPQVSLQEMIDDPKRSIVKMSLIVSLTFIVIKVNGFLDTMWVSRISGEATAAISSVNPLFTVVSAMGVGIGVGACICISYALGRHDYSRTQELAEAAVFMGLAASIPTIIFLLAALEPVISVQAPAIAEMARQYVLPLAVGCPFIILSGVLTSLLKSEGAVAKMALCTLVSVPVNAILTPLFINQLDMGVAGSSVGTAVAMFVSATLSYWILRHGDFHFKVRLRLPTESSIKEIVGTGGPVAIDTLVFGLLMLAQTVVVTIKTGSMTLSVVQLAFAFPYLMLIIPDSISSGSMPVCSALAGARKIDDMKHSMGFSVKMTIALALLSSLALLLFAEPILSLFSSGDSTRITDELILCARIYALSIPFFLISRVFTGFLQTIRKAYISTPVNVVMMMIKIGMIFLLATSALEVVVIELVMYTLTAVVMGAFLLRSLRRYDPDAVDSMVDNKLTFLWLLKKLGKSSE